MPVPGILQSAEADNLHQSIELKEGRYRFQSVDGWVEIPDLTSYCLECHELDGSPPGGTDKVSGPANGFHQHGGGNHPVDVQYPEARRNYRPADILDDRLELVGGRMTCLTCHVSTPNRSTVLPTAQGRLCTACHVK
jgi:hypothetical protein